MAIAVAAIALLAVVGQADAAIYWTDGGGIARSNNDGSMFSQVFIPRNSGGAPARVGTSEVQGCEGIAIDGSHIYWADPAHGAIDRAELNGWGIDYEFITGLQSPCGVGVDGSSVYWADSAAKTIGRANLEGGEVEREYITGVGEPCGVTTGGGYLYWTAWVAGNEAEELGEERGEYVARVPTAGGPRQKIFKGGEVGICGIAVDSGHAYFGSYSWAIGRVGLDGSEPEPSFVNGVYRPSGVAVFGSRLYWTRGDFQDRGISTAPLSEPSTISSAASDPIGSPAGVAVDSVQIPPPAPPPPPPVGPPASHEFSFGKPRQGSHAAVFLTVTFAQAGEFTVTGSPGIRVKVFPRGAVKRTRKLVAPESRLLKVWPAKGGPGAKALQAKLRKTGGVKVSLQVHFYAADHTDEVKRTILRLSAPRRQS
jgi:hypothetical protein